MKHQMHLHEARHRRFGWLTWCPCGWVSEWYEIPIEAAYAFRRHVGEEIATMFADE